MQINKPTVPVGNKNKWDEFKLRSELTAKLSIVSTAIESTLGHWRNNEKILRKSRDQLQKEVGNLKHTPFQNQPKYSYELDRKFIQKEEELFFELFDRTHHHAKAIVDLNLELLTICREAKRICTNSSGDSTGRSRNDPPPTVWSDFKKSLPNWAAKMGGLQDILTYLLWINDYEREIEEHKIWYEGYKQEIRGSLHHSKTRKQYVFQDDLKKITYKEGFLDMTGRWLEQGYTSFDNAMMNDTSGVGIPWLGIKCIHLHIKKKNAPVNLPEVTEKKKPWKGRTLGPDDDWFA